MSKAKKTFCWASLAFGTATLLLALFLMLGQRAHAAGIDNAPADPTDELYDGVEGVGDTYQGTDFPSVYFAYNNNNGEVAGTVQILLFLTVISLAPSILIMLTSYTRIIIVLHFVRNALGTMTVPPNQVLVGLSLFLTLFIMEPTFSEINEDAIKPLEAGEISQEEAFERGVQPLRQFMYRETEESDLALFCDIAEIELPPASEGEAGLDQIPLRVLIPSFILSELRAAFVMGFLIYIPFIVIDMVVASVLMSMGMMMLPPTTISLPFKILLFVLVDGWELVVENLMRTFH